MTLQEPTTVFAPDIMCPPADWKDAAHYEFIGFVMHSHTHHCTCCGAIERFSDTFRAFGRANSPSADNFKRMVRFDGHMPGQVSVSVMDLPARDIPICINCHSATKDGSVRFVHTTRDEWNEAIKRDRLAASAARAAAKEREPKVSTTAHISPLDLL